MASVEKDSVTGQMTTGHEWDGIKELNHPLPKWWVYVFWVTVIWAIAYTVFMPAWPLPNGFTPGVGNYSSRADLDAEVKKQTAERSVWLSKMQGLTVDAINGDNKLRSYALAGGKAVFKERCAACHGSGGVGAPGLYPILVDDEWAWGGTLADIEQTIKYGVRNSNSQSRQSEMPKLGLSQSLDATKVGLVADYVVALSQMSASAAGMPGEAIFIEECSACHGPAGVGIKEMGGPPLNNNIWLFKDPAKDVRTTVIEQVNAPKHGTMPAWIEVMDENTIKMLAVYVGSLGGVK